MIQKFTCHEEIDTMTASYILSVADANSIWQIPIEDINSFLEGLDDYIDDDDGQPGRVLALGVSPPRAPVATVNAFSALSDDDDLDDW